MLTFKHFSLHLASLPLVHSPTAYLTVFTNKSIQQQAKQHPKHIFPSIIHVGISKQVTELALTIPVRKRAPLHSFDNYMTVTWPRTKKKAFKKLQC